jgi:DNA-binding NarL/FixJ family response regulator
LHLAIESPALVRAVERAAEEQSFEIVGRTSSIERLAEPDVRRGDVLVVEAASHEDVAAWLDLAVRRLSGARLVLVVGSRLARDLARDPPTHPVAIVSTAATAEQLGRAIAAVAAGFTVLSGELLQSEASAANTVPQRQPEGGIEPLTPREREVLELVAEGLSNRAIAVELGISEHTVKFHVGSLLAKVGATTRAELVAVAVRNGLLML